MNTSTSRARATTRAKRKTATTTTPRRKATFRFPTEAALRAMPQRDRALSFLSFLRFKPRDETYVFGSNEECALAQFGQGVWPGHRVLAGTCDICAAKGRDPFCEDIDILDSIRNEQVDALDSSTTFGAAADRLAVALGVK